MWAITETAGCLNNYPKFLCSVVASIYGLQAYYIWQTFLCSRIFWRAVPLCLDNVWQSFFGILLFKLGQHTVSNQGKGILLPSGSLLTQRKDSLCGLFLMPIMFSEVDKCCQKQTWLIFIKKKNFGYWNILNTIYFRSLKCLKMTCQSKIISLLDLEDIPNVTTSQIILHFFFHK